MKHDQSMQILIRTIQSGWPNERRRCPKQIQDFWNIRDELAIVDDESSPLVIKGHRIVIPLEHLLYLLTPVYSLVAWAIDQSSPPDPALRHGCNFLPGVPHLPRFRLHVSPPGVSWPSSFPLPLGIPCQYLSCDASCRFSQRVTNPTQFSSFYFYFYWQLICLGPQSVVADFV